MPIKVTVWSENYHEPREPEVRRRYPDGIHGAIAAGLAEQLGERVRVRTAELADPEHGLSDKELADTDVLTWWGHMSHEDVADEVVGAGTPARARRHGPAGAALGALLEDLPRA